MAPKKLNNELTPKKIKMKKDSKTKLKKKKKSSTSNAAGNGTDNRGVDSEWWISFWDKNSPIPGISFYQLKSRTRNLCLCISSFVQF